MFLPTQSCLALSQRTFFIEGRVKQSPQSKNATENNESGRPVRNEHASKSARSGGGPPCCPSRVMAGGHQGAGKRPATRHCEHPRSTATPSQERRSAKQRRCIPCPGSCNQSTAVASHKLVILQFFVSSGSEQGGSVNVCCSWAGEALAGEGTPFTSTVSCAPW